MHINFTLIKEFKRVLLVSCFMVKKKFYLQVMLSRLVEQQELLLMSLLAVR
jgi:hypothetical protein